MKQASNRHLARRDAELSQKYGGGRGRVNQASSYIDYEGDDDVNVD
jgi:hypothetical protein